MNKLIDRFMRWCKSGTHRVVAAVIITITLMAIWSSASGAENPQPTQHRTTTGWIFIMPDGTDRFCGRYSEDSVRCVDRLGNQYKCEFHEPPVYFKNCEPYRFEE